MPAKRPWYLEYARPDGWWFLASYTTYDRALVRLHEMEQRKERPAQLRIRHRDDMTMKKPMTKFH